MSALDLVFAAVLVLSVLVGLWRGLVFEVLSVAGWVLAYFVAQRYAATVAAWLPLQGWSAPIPFAVGFGLVLVAVVFAAGLLTAVIKRVVATIGLRPIDRALGGVFGVLRGLVLLLAFAWMISLTPFKQEAWWQASSSAPLLESSLAALKGTMPPEIAMYFP
jgi:membrane protein required for colicin V production